MPEYSCYTDKGQMKQWVQGLTKFILLYFLKWMITYKSKMICFIISLELV